jgi:hypothetical protein
MSPSRQRATAAARVLIALQMLLLLGISPLHAFQGFDPNGQGSSYPRQANGRQTSVPSIRAQRVELEPIRVDGVLDEPVWRAAEAGTGFSMHEPDRGGIPTEETVFKVAYDDDAIYFAVACYEKDANQTKSALSRRDRLTDSDLVSVYIDPYLDRTTGYNFRVNPDGVQGDRYVFNDGDMDRDWDAVWQAETHRNGEGWSVEMRIPFSTIRYRPEESMTWGLQVYRYMQGRGEDDGWVTWDKETRGFVSRFGTVSDIQGIRSPRQLEVVPYVVQRSTDESADGREGLDNFGNFGADIRYGLTAALTLNATVQPDFGQVEADPAVLNLSPFETFFDEKRPFFIEGARFFQHPDFNLFYSRRIGTEDALGNSRIRVAGKLTGKSANGVSVGALVAATDIAGKGQAHNAFRSGSNPSQYFVGRLGKEFADGAHRFNVMQTASLWGVNHRNAYTTGVDFDLNFHDRDYNIQGSVVGSIVEPSALDEKPGGTLYGTGGALDIRKLGGKYRSGLWGRWESDRLELNDLGFLGAPDEIVGGWWGQRRFVGGESSPFNQGSANINLWSSVLYAGGASFDAEGNPLWTYDRGHHQGVGGNVNGWWQYENYWANWWGVWMDVEGTSKYETRGGPLMTEPERFGFWFGGETDTRKRLRLDSELEMSWSAVGTRRTDLELGMRWNQSTSVNHQIRFGYDVRHEDAQYIDTFIHENEDGTIDASRGIGGSSYVFGALDRTTFDVTLRSNLVFTRKQSLELYVQPFWATGRFSRGRELVTPDSYDLRPYADYDVRNADFNNTSFNLNLVYRWEYRPGSTLFLVWTQSRYTDESRGDMGSRFSADPRAGVIMRNEPENVFMAKLTYWFSI